MLIFNVPRVDCIARLHARIYEVPINRRLNIQHQTKNRPMAERAALKTLVAILKIQRTERNKD